MKKKGKTNQKEASGGQSSSALGCTPGELAQLQSLLALLREGSPALQTLLSGSQAGSVHPTQKTVVSSKTGASLAPAPTAAPPKKQTASSGWIPAKAKVKPRKETGPPGAEQPAREEILSSGNAKAMPSTKELTVAEPCVCLATMAEGRRAVEELKSQKPMAVLVPAKIDGQGAETDVYVKDIQGEKQRRTRYLVQLGAEPVVFDHSKVAYGKDVGAVNERVVVNGVEGKSPKDVWKALTDNPKSVVDKWLKTTAGLTEVGHLSKPRLMDGVLQVVKDVPPGSVVKAMAKSAEAGLFARNFVDAGGTTQYRKALLPVEHDRAAALRIAATMGGKALGVVPTRKGWAIQVLSVHFNEVATGVNPERTAQSSGAEYEVSGLPLSWNRENVTAFLAGWGAKPVGRPTRFGFRQTWTVRAENPPPSDEIRNPDSLGLNVLALVKAKVYKPKKPREVFTWSGKPAANSQQLPKSWSSVVKAPPPKVTKAAPAATTRTEATLEQAAPATQPDFMAQLQAMIVAAVAPLQAEIAAIKEVVEQDEEDQAEADEEDEDEIDEELKDATKRLADAADSEASKRGRTR